MCGLSLALWPAHTRAQTQAGPGPYVSLGAGAAFNGTLDGRYGGLSDRWRLRPGVSARTSFGWALGDGLRLEAEADLLTTAVRGVTDDAGLVRAGGLERKADGFVNVQYDVNLGLPVIPYLGLGLGGQAIEHDGFAAGATYPPVRARRVVGEAAYQGIAGVAYSLGFLPRLSLTAEYRFLRLIDPPPSFQVGAEAPGDAVRFSGDTDQSVMLGLRYVLTAPKRAVRDTPPPVAAPPGGATSRLYLVFFDWDRADLSTRARQIVAEAASSFTHVQTTRIEVNGYTDLSGSAAYNKRLSHRRGDSVQAELVRDGVAREAIAVIGDGEAGPTMRELRNRRVEIVLR